MTAQKHLKARIRARMAKTGERYAAARRHVTGDTGPVTDHGWTLRGGVHPNTAVISHLLADCADSGAWSSGRRGEPGQDGRMSEAMILGIGGGLGAGYILWEFARHDSRHLTLGFRKRWNYLDWTETTLDRLGVRHTVHTTAGAKGAADRLTAALAEGRRAIVVPDWYRIGYWHLPAFLDGHGGHPVVVYAQTGDRVHVDDRNTGPLTVDRAVLDAARARVSSYKNRLVLIDDVALPADLAGAARAGVADCVEHLGGTSTSFALPAWRKWAKLLTDRRNAKGWPRVFADGRGLTGALHAVWEGVEPVGMDGGHLRGLYADFLDEAAPLLGERAGDAAAAFRASAGAWHAFAEAALPADVPEYARLRELTAEVAEGVAVGAPAATAAAELWELRRELDAKPPVAPDLELLAGRLTTVAGAEESALAVLRTV